MGDAALLPSVKASILSTMENCNLSGLMRRCFYTGFVAEEKPGRGWRQGDVFKDDVDSDEEVVYEQRSRGMSKGVFYAERKRSMQMRELRQTDLVQEVAVAVIQKEPSLLLKEGKQKEENKGEEKGGKKNLHGIDK